MNVTPIDERFAEMVRGGRAVSRLPQSRVAKLMTGYGFPWGQQTVTRVETGSRTVSVGEAVTLAVVLRFDASLSKLGSSLRQLCAACAGEPPDGFTCNTCGRAGS